jgi:hypothetical protein
MCVEHLSLRMYGPGADEIACVDALALATSISLMRVVADHHYATDIIAGAAIGGISGGLLPWLVHFRGRVRHEAVADGGAQSSPRPQIVALVPTTDGRSLGLSLSGILP